MPVQRTFKEGLEDVVATTSGICYIDGERGVLAYRGIDIHELAEKSSFEEVAFLLWHGRLPREGELKELKARLSAERPLPDQALKLLGQLAQKASPMEALRTMVSALSMFDPETEDNSPEANLRKSIRLTAQFATIVAAYERQRNGQKPVPPDQSLDHAANFLYMMTGKPPDEVAARAMDVILVLHADHELNASTFAGRVTAATLSDIYSAITSAVGALKGPLHGGANEAVMRMLLEIGEADKAEAYIMNALAQKKKISGFGHRVYRTEDPRATHLREMSRRLGERVGNTKWYEMSRKIEEVMMREKGLNPNVDFYSASTYYSLGIAVDLYTPIFAVSRISGWTAHILEQYEHNRLIRPRAEYTGPPYPQPYLPMEKR